MNRFLQDEQKLLLAQKKRRERKLLLMNILKSSFLFKKILDGFKYFFMIFGVLVHSLPRKEWFS
ncbi:hypothetical protein A3C91_00570 [Candidatus Azambacteria bacterium RIFCSPHIGHO2_02_FULL_52_12]|uniref:Uncharacterized protein n=1 Tax=Candidatus Azambacteria bacterium RIFCSPLOWO2_01_FULL_46_25 TaxID=1797298 RepID=A0A1F5BTL9_9BACT|nr:MAG: hypothetical protein A3C91_00570 [Candidatus Azambacteria bacterium RIFCSPHIGHO2_02_FULL_52_12]OGD33955.1 MAG: hypothetical protein A2988_00480 [Candidatus Azambacteria bacterium RIFCSPLOWO2_01_FULL_46_25]OGD37641.1 MAG: hypothetical protein A2850_04555 [Candidatus Azambacteria bacterium RIFCSPHIGHO2_01_FULL_51_74]